MNVAGAEVEKRSFSPVISARVVPGHRVASGQNRDPRFPEGTLRMQMPVFRQMGLDLAGVFPGTLNVSVAPLRYRVVKPRLTFRQVRWHPAMPPEDFSFFDLRVHIAGRAPLEGLIYYPHPETKPEHFQSPDVLELLLPPVAELRYGDTIGLQVPPEQMVFEPPRQ